MVHCFEQLKIEHLDTDVVMHPCPSFRFAYQDGRRNVVLKSFCLKIKNAEGIVLKKTEQFLTDTDMQAGKLLETHHIVLQDLYLEPFKHYEWSVSGTAFCKDDGTVEEIPEVSKEFVTGDLNLSVKNAKWITLGKTLQEMMGNHFSFSTVFEPMINSFPHIYTANSMVGFIFGAKSEGDYALLTIYTDIDTEKVFAKVSRKKSGEEILLEKDITDSVPLCDYLGKKHTLLIQNAEDVSFTLDGHALFSIKTPITAGGFGYSEEYPHGMKVFETRFDSEKYHFLEDFKSADSLQFVGGVLDQDGGYIVQCNPVLFPIGATPAPIIKREFEVKEGLQDAFLTLSAAGIYEFFVNGQKINTEFFNPGRTRYETRMMAQTFVLSDYLKPGKNVLTVVLGHGWYNRAKYYAGPILALLGEIQLCYPGCTESILTDHEWKTYYDGPVCYDDFFNGEVIDERKNKEYYYKPSESGDASFALELNSQEAPKGEIVLDRGPRILAQETLKPVAITNPIEGVTVYDFGKNIAGICKIHVQGETGSRVILRHAELLNVKGLDNPDAELGRIFTRNLRSAANKDIFILAGNGTEVFEPTMTYHGFRYMELMTEGNAEILSVEAEVICSKMEMTGDFTCSNPSSINLSRIRVKV